MDDDQLTRQRAMDAAAAVAVAAAAAAHQNQEEGAQLQQQQHQHIRQDSHGERKPSLNGIQSLDIDEMRGSGNFDQQSAMPAAQVAGFTRKRTESTDTFADASMQYSASDLQGQDGDLSHLDDSHGTPSRPTVHHTKRRKINTCLPCKRRKVKCDREKPYCGQCKKHNFPPSECNWSSALIDLSPAKGSSAAASGLATSTAVADAAAAAAVSSAASASASQWYEMGNAPWTNFTPLTVEHSNQALLNRVVELEAALTATKSEGLNEDSRASEDQWNEKGAGMSEAERGMAADALAMIAQHDPQANVVSSSSSLTPNLYTPQKGKRLLPYGNNAIPLGGLPLEGGRDRAQVRQILSLLPDMTIIQHLLDRLETMQEYGLDTGVNQNMIKIQLDVMQKSIEKGREDDPIAPDLSFVALLFYILAFSTEMKDATEILTGLDLTEYTTDGQRQDVGQEVSELWSRAGQALLTLVDYENNPLFNVLLALSVKRLYLAARGKYTAARSTFATAMSLCETLGVAELSSGEVTQQLLPVAEAAQQLYSNVVIQVILHEDYSTYKLASFEYRDLGGGRNLTHALFELAKDVKKIKQDHPILQLSNGRQEESEAIELLKRKWNNLSQLINDSKNSATSIESIVEEHGLAVGFQWTILQINLQYQLMKLLRRRQQKASLRSANLLLRHRRWLEEQRSNIFIVRKFSTLQQMTLEAALLIALDVEAGDEDSNNDKLEVVDQAIVYLSTGQQELNHAQKLLRLISHSTKHQTENDTNEASIELRQVIQQAGFNVDHIIFKHILQNWTRGFDDGQDIDQFWKAIVSQGSRLLSSTPVQAFHHL